MVQRLIGRVTSSPIRVFLLIFIFLYISHVHDWLPFSDNAQNKIVRRNHDRALSAVDGVHGQSAIDGNADSFLQWLRHQCNDTGAAARATELCPCVPPVLYGHISIPVDLHSWQELASIHNDLEPGGHWAPHDCRSRQRVAFIIPVRDRETHLRMLLYHHIPVWKRQLIHFTVFVLEQTSEGRFNKAMIMNAGYLEARKLWPDFDCVIFHDVDMMLEDDRSIYMCGSQPRHLGAYVDKFRYKLTYEELFGGAVAFRPREHFEAVNGYSNLYFGWGGEDDDLYLRFKTKGIQVERFPANISRYRMLPHSSDKGNPVNEHRFRTETEIQANIAVDGLNSVTYTVVNVERRPLYTWILVKPGCPLSTKAYMGFSVKHILRETTLDLEVCKLTCIQDSGCRAVTWYFSTNQCSLHSEHAEPSPRQDTLYFYQDCSLLGVKEKR